MDVYQTFISGAKNAFELAITLFPYIASIFILVELALASNLVNFLKAPLSPIFNFLGVPPELFELIIFRPFSGSGSLALLEKIYVEHGVDSRISRIASVISSSSETIFYMSAIYFSTQGIKKLRGAITISLISTLFSIILACAIVH